MTYLRTCNVTCACGVTVALTIEGWEPFNRPQSDVLVATELHLLGWTPDGPNDDKCPACTEADA